MNIKETIEKSGLFDKVYYLKNNQDVRLADLTPLEHYCQIGIKEDRKPNVAFDPVWYKEYYQDVKNNDIYPLLHFIKFGRKENRFQNQSEFDTYSTLQNNKFDSEFYKNSYTDLKEQDSRFDPLMHYVRHGKSERRESIRFQNDIVRKNDKSDIDESVFQNEYEIIKNSNFFDIDFYLETYQDIKLAGLDPIKHYILKGALEGRKPNREFDTSFYLTEYNDIDINKINPLVHYILYGEKENRMIKRLLGKLAELKGALEDLSTEEQKKYRQISQFNLDWTNYFHVNSHTFTHTDPIADYVKNWKTFEPIVPNVFDTMYYLTSYPDIKAANINPLLHFLNYGKKEGRFGLFDNCKIAKGKLQYDAMKETIVFVSHESSATGAPLLGYGIANKLAEQYNIIHVVIKKANIHDAFLDNCDLMLHSIQQNPYIDTFFFLKELLKTRSVKCMMINSIVGYKALDAANAFGIPSVFLIHEFSEYMRPFGTIINTVMHADYVVVPATIIQDSVQKEFKRFANYAKVPENIRILPQGKLPFIPDTYGDSDSVEELYKKLKMNQTDDVKIIVASGWVQIRKGVDLFIAVARYIKKLYAGKCKFVWVGEGFDPDNDLAYSVYLEREIEFSGLEDDFLILKHQKNLDTIFSIADVFCLSSRMDPFPNVVIDALEHDLHIACFDHASGSAEFLRTHNANCTIVDFVDTYALAEGVVAYLNNPEAKQGVNKTILENYLNFDRYVEALDSLVNEAVDFKAKSKVITNVLLESGEFDADFYSSEGSEELRCREYVENGLKGFHFRNPKLGFSETKWIMQNPQNGLLTVPLYEALKTKSTITHDTVIVPTPNSNENINFIYAVHLHLYYIDMASLFVNYFSKLLGTYDLYITVVTKENHGEIYNQFSVCGARNVKIVQVENIGRDLGPLLFGLKNEMDVEQYEVIGHFHSKKSLDMASGGGDKWLTFLMNNLIDDGRVAHSILDLFTQEEVGLVFAEDRNTSDIGKNVPFIAELCTMLDLPLIKETPLFPLGNMFWARLTAMQQLFDLDPSVVLQKEPLPYDGSYMHALERITPSLVEKNGYKYVTVYNQGTQW